MADMRKVTVSPKDSEDYIAWLNFDRIRYIEDYGNHEDGHTACVVMDDQSCHVIKVERSWTNSHKKGGM